MLEVEGLSVQYGKHRAVDDAALSVGGERDRRHPGRQRCGQVDAAQGRGGPAAAWRRRARGARRPRAGRAAAAPDRRGRPGLGAGRPRHLRRADGAREPAAGRLRPARPCRRGAQPRARAGAVSAARRAARPDGAHHERRRAADGGDRPRADVGAADALAGRALAWPLAVAERRAVPRAWPHPRRRHRRAAGRAECAQESRHRRPRLFDREWPHRRRRPRGRACVRPGGAARLSRRRKGRDHEHARRQDLHRHRRRRQPRPARARHASRPKVPR